MYKELLLQVKKKSDKKRSLLSQRFFKTGKGEYGEGDKFLGLKVGECREIARKFIDMSIDNIQKLLDSPIHEVRLIALLILVERYKKADQKGKRGLASFYLKNSKKVNNWDLVDLSAHKILGDYFINKDKKVLYKLAKSKNIWERRISIISTAWFIKASKFSDTLKISDILINDKEDLIHKAVGWMLREVGKKDMGLLQKYLKTRYKKMPRTMLRYAIEKFPKNLYKKYLEGKV